MRANKIIGMAKDIRLSAERSVAECKNAIADIDTGIRNTVQDIKNAYEVFAKTQFMQNIEAYGNAAIKEIKIIEERRVEVSGLLDVERSNLIALESRSHELRSACDEERGKVAFALTLDADFIALQTTQREYYDRWLLDQGLKNKIEQEVQSKLEDYRSNRFFQYLFAADFGTNKYSKKGLIQRIDSELARRLGYLGLFNKYRTLGKILEHAINVFTRSKDAYDKQNKLCIDYEDRKYSNDAIVGLESKLDKTDAAIISKRQYIEKLESEYSRLLKGDDDSSRNVIDTIILTMSKSKSLEWLAEMANSTPSKVDDEAVKHLSQYMNSLDQLNIARDNANKNLNVKQAELLNALRMEKEVKQSRLSSSDYRYNNSDNINSLLLAYTLGNLTSNTFTSTLKGCSHYDPPYSPSRSSSSSFGSTSFSTTSSFGGGGGFSTTNSF